MAPLFGASCPMLLSVVLTDALDPNPLKKEQTSGVLVDQSMTPNCSVARQFRRIYHSGSSNLLNVARRHHRHNLLQSKLVMTSPPPENPSGNLLSKELLLGEMKKSIPALSCALHKGECGRIGIVGGSLEYTGAPYFAAIAALRVGCDLVHVFSMKEAAPVIKGYSPELIVHPILDSPNAVEAIAEWLPRIHAMVIGPGLGRDQSVMQNLGMIIKLVIELEIPLVIDGDGLFFINSNHHLIQGHTSVILTPNAVEFQRLYKSVTGTSLDRTLPPDPDSVVALAKQLGHVTILAKAEKDVVTNGVDLFIIEKIGSPRRCGGQGDLLTGILATFLFWKVRDKDSQEITLSAATSAALLSKSINRRAFEVKGRGTLASDMIPCIPAAFRELFGQE